MDNDARKGPSWPRNGHHKIRKKGEDRRKYMGYRAEDAAYDRQQEQAQREMDTLHTIEMLLDEIRIMRGIMERWEEREKDKDEIPKYPYAPYPDPYPQPALYTSPKADNPIHPSSSEGKIGDSRIEFPVYNGKSPSITIPLVIAMPKTFSQALYEAELFCRAVSKQELRVNARFHFNDYTVYVIYARELKVDFYAICVHKLDEQQVYRYCLHRTDGLKYHWSLMNDQATDGR